MEAPVTRQNEAVEGPGGIARYLGPVGRWPWLARLLAEVRMGAWIPIPALRLAWIAFVLTFPGALSTWTVLFVVRHALGEVTRAVARKIEPFDAPTRPPARPARAVPASHTPSNGLTFGRV